MVLLAIFDYMISKPFNSVNVELLPQLSDKTLTKVIESTLSAKTVKKNKFDSIYKILLKRGDAERLASLAINVSKGRIQLESPAGGYLELSQREKLELVSSGLHMIEQQKSLLSEDGYIKLKEQLNNIADRIEE